MGKAHKPASVKDLIASTTFLQSLTPTERSELLRPTGKAPSSPTRTPAKHPSAVTSPSPWGSPSRSHAADRWQQLDEEARGTQQNHSAWLLDGRSDAMHAEQQLQPYCTEGGLQDEGDKQHLLEESIILLEHRAQLQVQVDELQRQLTAMQKQQRRQQQQCAPLTDPAQYHAVITGLRASMAQVGSMASSVSQENKLLVAENKRLAGLKEQQEEAIRHLQARICQLEGNLLQQLAENSRDTLQQAEAAAVGAKLDAMLTPELLAAAAGQPPSGSSGSSLLVEEMAAGNNQLRPLLSELSALRRAQQSLQKQVAQLQQQLSTAERGAQAASVAAAADKAHARRTIGQAHTRLSAALQRLSALAERQQQQNAMLQEREDYITRLERRLVQQNSELVRLANSVTSNSSSTTANRPTAARHGSTRDGNGGGGNGGGSRRRSTAGGSSGSRHQNPRQLQLRGLEDRVEVGAGSAPAQGGQNEADGADSPAAMHVHAGNTHNSQQQQQRVQSSQRQGVQSPQQRDSSPLRSPSPQPRQQQQQQELPQQQVVLSPGRRTWQLPPSQQQQQQQQQQQHKQPQEQQQQQQVGEDTRDSSRGRHISSRSSSPCAVQPSPQTLAVSRAAVALQCREIMAHTTAHPGDTDGTASDDQAGATAAAAVAEGGQGMAARSRSPNRVARGAPGLHHNAQSTTAPHSQLPSFTAAAGRMQGVGLPAGVRPQQLQQQHLRHVSSRSSGSAGAAARRIAAAAAAVAALDSGTRGLWGNSSTLGGGGSSSRAQAQSPPGTAGRLTPQQLQQQRQARLRELLQQKQRPRGASASSLQQQLGAGVGWGGGTHASGLEGGKVEQQKVLQTRHRAAAAAQGGWHHRSTSHHQQQQQQQEHEDAGGQEEEGEEEEEAEASLCAEGGRGGGRLSEGAVGRVAGRQKQQEPHYGDSKEQQPQWSMKQQGGRQQEQRQQQQLLGARSASAPPPILQVAAGTGLGDSPAPGAPSQQHHGSKGLGQRGASSATPATAAERSSRQAHTGLRAQGSGAGAGGGGVDHTPAASSPQGCWAAPSPTGPPVAEEEQAAADMLLGGDAGGLQQQRRQVQQRPQFEGMPAEMDAAGDGEGLMYEVLAMQQNLQELEQDLLQLGCEFD